MYIKNVPYSRLLKLELPAFARKVIDIVDEYDAEELKIKDSYDLLLAQQSTIDLLKMPYRAHPVTPQLTPPRQKCSLYAQALVYRINVLVKDHANQPNGQVLDTLAVIKMHLHRLDLCKNEVVMNERIAGFFTEYQNSLAIQTALTDFGLVREFDNLMDAHSELRQLLMKRTKSISERTKLKSREIAKPLQESLKNLFKHIEVNYVVNSDLNYAPLINLLNQTITELRNKVNIRLQNNKRKAMGLEPIESDQESTNPEETTAMMDHRSVEALMGDGLEKGFDEKLDQKKTAASATKLLQLPSISNGHD